MRAPNPRNKGFPLSTCLRTVQAPESGSNSLFCNCGSLPWRIWMDRRIWKACQSPASICLAWAWPRNPQGLVLGSRKWANPCLQPVFFWCSGLRLLVCWPSRVSYTPFPGSLEFHRDPPNCDPLGLVFHWLTRPCCRRPFVSHRRVQSQNTLGRFRELLRRFRDPRRRVVRVCPVSHYYCY